MNFVIVDSDRHHLREILNENVPAFLASAEHAELGEDSQTSDGLLITAFTRYTERMLREKANLEIAACLAAIERFASSRDPQVVNYVYTDIFDMLTGESYDSLEPRLGPNARQLYDDWLRRLKEAKRSGW